MAAYWYNLFLSSRETHSFPLTIRSVSRNLLERDKRSLQDIAHKEVDNLIGELANSLISSYRRRDDFIKLQSTSTKDRDLLDMLIQSFETILQNTAFTFTEMYNDEKHVTKNGEKTMIELVHTSLDQLNDIAEFVRENS